jgi:hypothetical protein
MKVIIREAAQDDIERIHAWAAPAYSPRSRMAAIDLTLLRA